MEKEYKMSQARKDELEQELNYLKTTRSDEVAEQIKIARGFGDLSENSEYDEAKNEQGKLYSRIAELEVILQHVVIVDESAASDTIKMCIRDRVKINQLGTTVVVVTHEKDLVNKFGKRVITIDQGRIINDSVGGYVGGHIHE